MALTQDGIRSPLEKGRLTRRAGGSWQEQDVSPRDAQSSRALATFLLLLPLAPVTCSYRLLLSPAPDR